MEKSSGFVVYSFNGKFGGEFAFCVFMCTLRHCNGMLHDCEDEML